MLRSKHVRNSERRYKDNAMCGVNQWVLHINDEALKLALTIPQPTEESHSPQKLLCTPGMWLNTYRTQQHHLRLPTQRDELQHLHNRKIHILAQLAR